MASGNQHKKLPHAWGAVDPDSFCRNWVDRVDGGGQVRMSAFVYLLEQAATLIMHLLGRCPRVVFSKLLTEPTCPTDSSEPSEGADNSPLYRYKLFDQVTNAHMRDFRTVALPRETDVGDAYIQRTDRNTAVDANTKGLINHGEKGSQAVIADRWHETTLVYDRYTDRGAAPDAREEEGIATFNDHRVLCALVQDHQYTALDTTISDYIPEVPLADDPILGGQILERLRSKLHDIRSKNLPIVASWAATAITGNYATTAITGDSGGATGIRIIDTANFCNLLKPSVSAAAPAFSDTAPGWPCHVQYCGVGTTAKDDGKKLRCEIHILGRATNTDATVRVIGPDTFASNSTDITIATASGLAWFGGSGNTIFLNTAVANDDDTSNRPKIEGHGKAGHIDGMYVYGFFALAVYGLS
jgi:hypothetical protein